MPLILLLMGGLGLTILAVVSKKSAPPPEASPQLQIVLSNPNPISTAQTALTGGIQRPPSPSVVDSLVNKAEGALINKVENTVVSTLVNPGNLQDAAGAVAPFGLDAAAVAIPVAAVGVMIASVVGAKSLDQLRSEAIANGQKAFDETSAAAFTAGLAAGPVGSPQFSAVVDANGVQNVGDKRVLGRIL